jgi:L-alanine-DL-glutamate epimerase-like enolase superfamily enzyme
MKITDVVVKRVRGRYDGPRYPFGGWQITPSALYPFPQEPPPHATGERDPGEMSANYVEVTTDAGVTGMYGPVDEPGAWVVSAYLRPFLIGRDPLAHELLSDQMLRLNRHGRSGLFVLGISTVDFALWDLKGKVLNLPVYRLLGGATRERIPVYASMLGFSDAPEDVARVARDYAAEGYTAQKWFFRCGPAHGSAGMDRNLAMAQAVRDAVGPRYPIMFDAFMSWDLTYAREMVRELAPLRPRWLEEPLPPEHVGALRALRGQGVPIASGEHVYTRWQTKELLAAEAVDVLQNDPDWTGGMTESLKIAALASSFDVPLYPHGHEVVPALHLAASQSPTVVPMVEYLVQMQDEKQFFQTPKHRPHQGFLALPTGPGWGIVLDEENTAPEPA